MQNVETHTNSQVSGLTPRQRLVPGTQPVLGTAGLKPALASHGQGPGSILHHAPATIVLNKGWSLTGALVGAQSTKNEHGSSSHCHGGIEIVRYCKSHLQQFEAENGYSSLKTEMRSLPLKNGYVCPKERFGPKKKAQGA